MDYLTAFLVGGLICAGAQVIFDRTTLTMGHVMVLVVVMGSVLTGLGLYDPLIQFGGAGATTPVSNFGYVMTKGVVQALETDGWFGMLSGVFALAGGAIAAVILFGFLIALVFRAKG